MNLTSMLTCFRFFLFVSSLQCLVLFSWCHLSWDHLELEVVRAVGSRNTPRQDVVDTVPDFEFWVKFIQL